MSKKNNLKTRKNGHQYALQRKSELSAAFEVEHPKIYAHRKALPTRRRA